MSILGSAAIAGGASLIGGAISGLFGSKSSKKANQSNERLAAQQNEYNLQYQANEFAQNQKMSDLEYQRNLEQWHLQNEYNSPAQQRQRLVEAGLNPNLVYGSGTASAGNATGSPQYQAARYKAPNAERATVHPQGFVPPAIDPYQAVGLGQQLAMQKAQVSQLAAQTEFTKQQTANAALESLFKTARTAGVHLDNAKKSSLFDLSIDQARANLAKTQSSTSLDSARLDLQRVLNDRARALAPLQVKQLQTSIDRLKVTRDLDAFRLQLLRLGISDKDGLVSRLAARWLIDPANSSAVDSIKNFFSPSQFVKDVRHDVGAIWNIFKKTPRGFIGR
ncbi:DNA pilot protein [Tortoise microvirus 33]|nr:DNA pilot protein [Tortoise microvirus 33]